MFQNLDDHIKPGKALIIYGSRQVGKTTLLQNFLKHSPWKYRLVSGDDLRSQLVLGSGDSGQLLEYISGYGLLAIDEAQKIPRIGQGLKIMVDRMPDIRIIATGSLLFELAGQIGEPLTGKKNNPYPVSGFPT